MADTTEQPDALDPALLAAIKAAERAGLQGQARADYIEQFVRGYEVGAAQVRERWQRLSEHPRFREHWHFAIELYARTGDLESTLAALDVDISKDVPS